MSTSPTERRPLAQAVRFSEHDLIVDLVDGRSLAVPLEWFPRLARAAPVDREAWELVGGGEGIHWPELDEDLSVEGLLAGRRSRGVA